MSQRSAAAYPAITHQRTTARAILPERGRSLRICHVAYTFYENDSRVIRYAEALANRGDHVDVISLRRQGQSMCDSFNGVRILRIQRRAVREGHPLEYFLKTVLFFVKAAVLLTVLHLRKRYDVVHAHNIPDFLVFAALVPRLTGGRVILDVHDIVPELYAGKFRSARNSAAFRALVWIERLSCRFAAHVIVANHLWYETLVRRSVPAEKASVVLNYPDLRLFKPQRNRNRRTDDNFIMLYPGTLNHHQGVDTAVEAFGLVQHRMPGAELHIYGEGPTRARIERIARERGLCGRVRLMDRLPLNKIAEVIASSHLGVVPKRADGFGNEAFSTKVLEFMACGVPVVVSRTKIDQHYFDDTLVRFFTPGDVIDLARVMLDAYGHRSEGDSRARLALDFAALNSWQERSRDYLGIVEALVAKPPSLDAVTS